MGKKWRVKNRRSEKSIFPDHKNTYGNISVGTKDKYLPEESGFEMSPFLRLHPNK